MNNLRSNFNWGPVSFLVGYHLLLLFAIPLSLLFHPPTAKILIITILLLFFTGISVTAGYHRLYSHVTYKTNPVVEVFLLFLSSMAAQGSALRWSFEHRCHHAFVDTDKDPYSIKKGFWYAHFLWILEKPKPIDPAIVADLRKNTLLRLQDRFYPLLMMVTNTLTTLAIGWYLNDYLNAFLYTWLLRMFFLHHLTWFINSLAHMWGARTYCQEISAVDNYLISILTFGEGYHNYHHKFAYDYRNGIRWYHFDPTKWLIWTLNKFKLAHQLKKVPASLLQEKLLINRKQLLLDQLSTSKSTLKEGWETKISQMVESLLAKVHEHKRLKEQYSHLKRKAPTNKEILRSLHSEIKTLGKSIRQESRLWSGLSRQVMTLE